MHPSSRRVTDFLPRGERTPLRNDPGATMEAWGRHGAGRVATDRVPIVTHCIRQIDNTLLTCRPPTRHRQTGVTDQITPSRHRVTPYTPIQNPGARKHTQRQRTEPPSSSLLHTAVILPTYTCIAETQQPKAASPHRITISCSPRRCGRERDPHAASRAQLRLLHPLHSAHGLLAQSDVVVVVVV